MKQRILYLIKFFSKRALIKVLKKCLNRDKNVKEKNISQKDYSPAFWKWFGVFTALLGLAGATMTGELPNEILYSTILAHIIVVIFFTRMTHRIFKATGKNYGWAIGLLAIIPFGFLIAFLVAKIKLEKVGMWFNSHKSFKLTRGNNYGRKNNIGPINE